MTLTHDRLTHDQKNVTVISHLIKKEAPMDYTVTTRSFNGKLRVSEQTIIGDAETVVRKIFASWQNGHAFFRVDGNTKESYIRPRLSGRIKQAVTELLSRDDIINVRILSYHPHRGLVSQTINRSNTNHYGHGN
jgi:hypothetical protein